MRDAIPSDPTDSLSGPFVGELHGVILRDQADIYGADRPVTIGVVVCPACSALVFSQGWPSHEARHNGGLL